MNPWLNEDDVWADLSWLKSAVEKLSDNESVEHKHSAYAGETAYGSQASRFLVEKENAVTVDPRVCCCGDRGQYCAVHDIPPVSSSQVEDIGT